MPKVPLYLSMLMILVTAYCVALIVGSMLMLEGVSKAPVGYEDENGFHQLPSED